MKNTKSGFTLIELLVVVAIIGLLSTLSILALNSARARARDAKRVADVKQIQTALEMYYNDMGNYPLTASVTPGAAIYSPNDPTHPFLKQVPAPPTPADGSACATAALTSYTYTNTNTAGGGGTYTLVYCLGANVNNITGNQLQTATPAGIY